MKFNIADKVYVNSNLSYDEVYPILKGPQEPTEVLKLEREINVAITRNSVGSNVDANSVLSPCVIKDGSEYKIWYTGFHKTGDYNYDHYQICYASASGINGEDWENFQRVVPSSSQGAYDDYGALSPSVIKDGSIYKMWYVGREASGTQRRIIYCESFTGTTWSGFQVVMSHNSEGTYDTSWLSAPSIIKDNSTYKMWYTGNGSRIIYCDSADGKSWSNHQMVVDIGSEGTYDINKVFSASVIKVNEKYLMVYTADDGSNFRIIYCDSDDGINWSNFSLAVDVGNLWNYDGRHCHGPTLLNDDGIYRIWYGAADSGLDSAYKNEDPDRLGSSSFFYYDSYVNSFWTHWTKILNGVLDYQNTSFLIEGNYPVEFSNSVFFEFDLGHRINLDSIRYYFESASASGITASGIEIYCKNDFEDSYSKLNTNIGTNYYYSNLNSPRYILLNHTISGTSVSGVITGISILTEDSEVAFGIDGSETSKSFSYLIDSNYHIESIPIYNNTLQNSNAYIFIETENEDLLKATYLSDSSSGPWIRAYDLKDLLISPSNLDKGLYEGTINDDDVLKLSLNVTDLIDRHVAISRGSEGTHDNHAVYSPCVIKDDDGLYKMWYTGMKKSGDYTYSNSHPVIIYTSASGIGGEYWTDFQIVVTENILGPDYDDYGATNPCVIKDNNKYKMWYVGRHFPSSYAKLIYCESDNGTTWSGHQGVMSNNAEHIYDTSSITGQCVIKDDNLYKMWYTGNGNRILYCISEDGKKWRLHQMVIDTGSEGTYDTNRATSVSVLKENNIYRMWYSGYNGSNYRIIYCDSFDGINWSNFSLVGDIGGLPPYDSINCQTPCVINDDGVYRIWYTGTDSTIDSGYKEEDMDRPNSSSFYYYDHYINSFWISHRILSGVFDNTGIVFGTYTSPVYKSEEDNKFKFLDADYTIVSGTNIAVNENDSYLSIEIRSSNIEPIPNILYRTLYEIGYAPLGLGYKDYWLHNNELFYTSPQIYTGPNSSSYDSSVCYIDPIYNDNFAFLGVAAAGSMPYPYGGAFVYRNFEESDEYQNIYYHYGADSRNYYVRGNFIFMGVEGDIWVYVMSTNNDPGQSQGYPINNEGYYLLHFNSDFELDLNIRRINDFIFDYSYDRKNGHFCYYDDNSNAIVKRDKNGETIFISIPEGHISNFKALAIKEDKTLLYVDDTLLRKLDENGNLITGADLDLSYYIYDAIGITAMEYDKYHDLIWILTASNNVYCLYSDYRLKFKFYKENVRSITPTEIGLWMADNSENHLLDIDLEDIKYSTTNLTNDSQAGIYVDYYGSVNTEFNNLPLEDDPVWSNLEWNKINPEGYMLPNKKYHQVRITLRRNLIEPTWVEVSPEFEKLYANSAIKLENISPNNYKNLYLKTNANRLTYGIKYDANLVVGWEVLI